MAFHGGYPVTFRPLLFAAFVFATTAATAHAGVVNPDISVIGQPFARWTNDATDPGNKRWVLDPGEVETVFDAPLNPYARGTVVMSLSEPGIELEEGYFQLLRGLPGGLALKGGKYRVGFGKLNPAHPHAYPFADRFHMLATYLPGDESFNETGISLSERIPAPGDLSLTASLDWLNGNTFRLAREASGASNDPLLTIGADADRPDESRAAVLGRLAAFSSIGDRSGLELGVSGSQGTNNVAAGARTTLIGADAKAKLWNSENSYLLLQGEFVHLDRDLAGWDSLTAAYTLTRVSPAGACLFADYNFATRYNVGASYERWQQATVDRTWDQAFKAFAGFALLEETTAFRLDWDHDMPGSPPGAPSTPDAIDTVTMRVIFSMGPHKAHQF